MDQGLQIVESSQDEDRAESREANDASAAPTLLTLPDQFLGEKFGLRLSSKIQHDQLPLNLRLYQLNGELVEKRFEISAYKEEE